MSEFVHLHGDVVNRFSLGKSFCAFRALLQADGVGVFFVELTEDYLLEVAGEVIHVHDEGFLVDFELEAFDVSEVAFQQNLLTRPCIKHRIRHTPNNTKLILPFCLFSKNSNKILLLHREFQCFPELL